MEEKERITNFDILKIFAAICIVFHHYQQLGQVSFNWINFYNGRFVFGYLVELFFIISGFLAAMTSNYSDGILRPIIRKIIRIYPMACLAILFNFVVFLIYRNISGQYMFETSFNIPQIVTSFLLLNQGWIVEFAPAINNPIWYVCVLLWLNILFTIIIFISRGNKRIEVIVSVFFFLLGAVGWKLKWKYEFDLPFMHLSDIRGYTAFFMGVCLYHVYCKWGQKQRFFISIGLMLSSILGMLVWGMGNWYVYVILLFPGVVLFCTSIPQCNYHSLVLWGGEGIV